jgi:biopolymer transport protein ExbB
MTTGLLILLLWLVLAIAGAVASVHWAWRLWMRKKLSVTTIVAALAAATALLAAVGTAGGMIGMIQAVSAGSAETVDPSQKARLLAEGISVAMNCTALGLVVALPVILVVAYVTRRKRSDSPD